MTSFSRTQQHQTSRFAFPAKNLVIFTMLITCFCFLLVPENVFAAVSSAEILVKNFIVSVNGQRKLVPAAETLDIVYGDIFIVHDFIVAKELNAKDAYIDIEGFKPLTTDGSKTVKDKRNFVVQTDRDLPSLLIAQTNLNSPKKVTIKLKTFAEKDLGFFNINVLPVALSRLDLSLNGALLQVKPGDVIKLRPSDSIAIKHIATNVYKNENITFRIEKDIKRTAGQPNSRSLVLYRGSQAFERIPIQWQE